MSTDDGPRRGTQRSVAELLAAYSAETPQAPRRRGPEDAPPPEPSAPAAGYPAPGPETRAAGYTPSYGGPASDPGYGSSTGYVPPPAPGGYGASPYGASPYPAQGPTAYTPAPPPPPQPPPPQPPLPPAPPQQQAPPQGPPTPASASIDYDEDEGDDGFYRVDDRERPGRSAPGGGGTAMLAAPDAAPAGLDADRDDLDDRDEDEYDDDAEYDDAPRSGVREWAVLVAQLLAGAVLGAVLWTVFSFLWGAVPIVALVLALVATTGLVFGVRALRRSDDLQTTLLAVFVGLVVTVSPATVALLGN